jgi:competence/damage-inducible protein CinA-like protein
MSPPRAEILATGSELLLGEILDTNTRQIALGLRGIGLNLFRASIVGDNLERISEAVRLACSRSEVLLTTGGLGPTVDDMTRQAVADAAGVELEFDPDLWSQIEDRYRQYGRRPNENNRRQAHLPGGSRPIHNPVGTAPGFWLRIRDCLVISMPGVPSELTIMLERAVYPLLQNELKLQATIQTRILRTVGIGESDLDAKIGELELSANPTLGVSAHPGRVDLRLGARAESPAEARAMLDGLEAELHQRLGDLIYAEGDISLEKVTMRRIRELGWSVLVVESGTNGHLSASLSPFSPPFSLGFVMSGAAWGPVRERIQLERVRTGADVALGLQVTEHGVGRWLEGLLITPIGEDEFASRYAGPEDHAAAWGASALLNRIRRHLPEGTD